MACSGLLKGRGETFVVNVGFSGRAPSKAAEAWREADAYSRAASPRGCTRLRRKPLAGEPRREADDKPRRLTTRLHPTSQKAARR